MVKKKRKKEVYLTHLGDPNPDTWWLGPHALNPGFDPKDGSQPIRENEIFRFRWDSNWCRNNHHLHTKHNAHTRNDYSRPIRRQALRCSIS